MTEAKTKPTSHSAEAFIEQQADAQRRADCYKLIELMQAATKAKPLMWGASIIGFGKYKYQYASGAEGEWPIIGFSPRKNDLTLYIMPGFSKYDELMQKLGKHKTGKSCLYLKRLADVDEKVLKQLIVASVKAMASKRVE
jgi:hypothetical protein